MLEAMDFFAACDALVGRAYRFAASGRSRST
jgi:hypothetical protein